MSLLLLNQRIHSFLFFFSPLPFSRLGQPHESREALRTGGGHRPVDSRGRGRGGGSAPCRRRSNSHPRPSQRSCHVKRPCRLPCSLRREPPHPLGSLHASRHYALFRHVFQPLLNPLPQRLGAPQWTLKGLRRSTSRRCGRLGLCLCLRRAPPCSGGLLGSSSTASRGRKRSLRFLGGYTQSNSGWLPGTRGLQFFNGGGDPVALSELHEEIRCSRHVPNLLTLRNLHLEAVLLPREPSLSGSFRVLVLALLFLHRLATSRRRRGTCQGSSTLRLATCQDRGQRREKVSLQESGSPLHVLSSAALVRARVFLLDCHRVCLGSVDDHLSELGSDCS
mmetsp:Transcript_1479/g.3063  ORF Transcript_1479/g.3063 Transcript_1479/m.3063 type:complete len:335 (-) Transcript_1479:647-1651(-)